MYNAYSSWRYDVCRVFGCCVTVDGPALSCPAHATWMICPACWDWPVLRRKFCRPCGGKEWMPPRTTARWLVSQLVAPDGMLRVLRRVARGGPVELGDPDVELGPLASSRDVSTRRPAAPSPAELGAPWYAGDDS